MGLIVYLLIFWVLTWIYHSFLLPRNAKAKRMIKIARHQIKDRRKWDRDQLTEQQDADLTALAAYLDELESMLKELPTLQKEAAAKPDDQALAAKLEEYTARTEPDALKALTKSMKVPAAPQKSATKSAKKSKKGSKFEHEVGEGAMTSIRGKLSKKAKSDGGSDMSPEALLADAKGFLELVIVVFGVVAGLRGLFIQPFKIPTGSMQPTLYGIWFTPVDDPADIPGNPVVKFFDWVNRGRTYVDATTTNGGPLVPGNVRYAQQSGLKQMIAPKSAVSVGAETIELPGAPVDAAKYLVPYHHGYVSRNEKEQTPVYLEPGDVVARGYLTQGDHLFVDRVSYNFTEPKRGDIVVFSTAGMTTSGDEFGRPLTGLFYIKRLVGLPGESIMVRDRRLYVREAGASEFRLVDGADNLAFDRMYSEQGDYRGYTPRERLADGGVIELGPDQYLMMGDNSENSLDGRYFGAVSRDRIVGRAIMVWWPFTRRWGLVDRAEPLPYDSVLDPKQDGQSRAPRPPSPDGYIYDE